MGEEWEEEGGDNYSLPRCRKVSQRAWQPLESKLTGVEKRLCTHLPEDTLRKYWVKASYWGLIGVCKYYPCHHGDLEDCTFYCCPFYPCGDESAGDKWIKGTTWSCEDCSWIHRTEVAGRVLREMKRLGIDKP